ncbi:MAG TPA: FAD-linked oxidase C-terminal domain-containing protein, partial [Candidatus Acidoferrales bacterium]|nr:FAD-linked oxidase C-terminal domain-containing protein [Candidatus Acidoferrales bacterium]
YLRDLRALMNEFGYVGAFYGHFGHGCVHMRVSFDLRSEPGIRKFTEFMERASDLVLSYGGSLSGEHGDGQSRAALLPKMFGPELMRAFAEFKAAWDPANGMNPHKVVDPYGIAENLRLGADYKPAQLATHFRFPQDDGSLVKAAERCIGLGACRKNDSGAMCPSYMVTLEEEHSTRGRARMLFELLQGEVVRGGWRDEQVKHALDLCLACKACKSECPANVDMATYKAEFLSHYYEGKQRPLFARVFGRIDRWLRVAGRVPGAANLLARAPVTGHVLRAALGLAVERELPRLAPASFLDWARKHPTPSMPAGREVVLWVDTFNNYFHPGTLRAAQEVLTAAGFRVSIPEQQACCGRPLYDFGMLDDAKKYLDRVLSGLARELDAGLPIVVLEPSCASVFRDELGNLLPEHPRAEAMRKQTFLLSEFLEQQSPEIALPRLERKVLLHGHCHQKALMKMTHAESLLRRMGAQVEMPDTGCCGMAGPFGFEREK